MALCVTYCVSWEVSLSCDASSVTVCGVLQFPVVKVMLAGFTLTFDGAVTATVTCSVGALSSQIL